MLVCIVGCGAIGGIFAAHLAQHADVQVWAYDKDDAHVDAINRDGLRLTGVRKLSASIRATTDASAIPACDIIVVATKSKHTADAMRAVAHLTPDSVVCSLQNGIANEALIANQARGVISGTVMVGGHVQAPGIIDFDTSGDNWIGRAHGIVESSLVQRFADLLRASGLKTEVVDDPRSAKWTKLVFNAAANPLCALTGLPYGQVYRDASLRALMYGLADEGVAVAEAQGVALLADPRTLLDEAAQTADAHQPSMLSDVLNKAQTEVDAINGDIVKFAQQAQIPCPLNQAMVALVKGLERSWLL